MVNSLQHSILRMAGRTRNFFTQSFNGDLIALKQREFNEALLDTHVNRKLTDLISFVWNNNSFYRDYWQSRGVREDMIGAITKAQDLERLPIVNKKSLRSADKNQRWISQGFNREQLFSADTTGSSGEPFTVYLTTEEVAEKNLLGKRAARWWGNTGGNKLLLLWRKKDLNNDQKLMSKLGLFKKIEVLDVDNKDENYLDEPSIRRIVDQISHFQPDIIHGYVSVLKLIAQHLVKNNINSIRPKSVIGAAEPLPDEIKLLIEKAFRAKAFNMYGATEGSLMALSCPDGSDLHLMSDFYCLELLDNQGQPVGPGKIGNIVLTDLTVKSAPFVRYKIGDLAAWSVDQCSCGRYLPTLSTIYGREDDIVLLGDGQKILPHVWYRYFRDLPAIEQFQILQREKNEIDISIVIDQQYSDAIISQLEQKFRQLFPGTNFCWRKVENIPPNPGGKIRAIQSLVK